MSWGSVIVGWVRLIGARGLTILGPSTWEAVLGASKGSALFPHVSPALFTMPLSFPGCWAFSVNDTSRRAATDKAGFEAQHCRSQTRIGAEGAGAH